MLSADDLKLISESELGKKLGLSNDLEWSTIVEECDLNGDGVLDFQEFISVVFDRKALIKKDDLKRAFRLIDVDKDGQVTKKDFTSLFNSYDKKARLVQDSVVWEQILQEADRSGRGKICFEDFSQTMTEMIRKSWLRKAD